MPVLPDDGSMIVRPGLSVPSSSASWIIFQAIRSLIEPPGFWPSSLARMRTAGLGLNALTSTSGVLPMSSRTEEWPGIAPIVFLSYPVTILLPVEPHLLLGYRTVDDAVRPQHRRLPLERDDHVVPGRVGGLRHVGGRRVGLGMRVAVHHPHDLEPPSLGVAVGAQVVAGIDGVEPARLGSVAAGVEHPDPAGRGIPAQQPARLIGHAVVRVSHHLAPHGLGEGEGARLHDRRGYPSLSPWHVRRAPSSSPPTGEGGAHTRPTGPATPAAYWTRGVRSAC